MRGHWQDSLTALSLLALGCYLNHDFSVLSPAGVQPQAVPTFTLLVVSPPRSPPCSDSGLMDGVKEGLRAEFDLDTAVSKMRLHCDGVL